MYKIVDQISRDYTSQEISTIIVELIELDNYQEQIIKTLDLLFKKLNDENRIKTLDLLIGDVSSDRVVDNKHSVEFIEEFNVDITQERIYSVDTVAGDEQPVKGSVSVDDDDDFLDYKVCIDVGTGVVVGEQLVKGSGEVVDEQPVKGSGDEQNEGNAFIQVGVRGCDERYQINRRVDVSQNDGDIANVGGEQVVLPEGYSVDQYYRVKAETGIMSDKEIKEFASMLMGGGDEHENRLIGSVCLLDKNGCVIRTVKCNHHHQYYASIMDAIEVSAKKNADYAGGLMKDPLANFKEVAESGIDPTVGLWTRATDKIGRIKTFFREGKLSVESETVVDAFMDLGNYCFLMTALMQDEKESVG